MSCGKGHLSSITSRPSRNLYSTIKRDSWEKGVKDRTWIEENAVEGVNRLRSTGRGRGRRSSSKPEDHIDLNGGVSEFWLRSRVGLVNRSGRPRVSPVTGGRFRRDSR